MEYETKQKIKKMMDVVISTFKILAFASLIVTAIVLYNIGSTYIANDILIAAVLFLIANKIDKMEGK